LHRPLRGRDRFLRLGDRLARHLGRIGFLDPARGLGERSGDVGQQAFGLAAGLRAVDRRLAGRVLRALVAVERVVEREAIVALRHGFLRALERRFGGGELVGRIAFGAGSTRRFDGAVRLVEFAAGRVAAPRDEHREHREHRDRTPTDGAGHRSPVYATAMTGGTPDGDLRIDRPAPHDRPREKLARLGADALGDQELLALVVGPGAPGRSALALATAVLARTGGLRGVARARLDELRQVPALGLARAARIVAAVELGRRSLTQVDEERPLFKAPHDLALFLLPRFGARPVEHFGVVLLDARHRWLGTKVLGVGTLDASLVHPRDVFREATLGGAAAIALFHNHPSGDPSPTRADGSVTERMAAAGRLMGIDVIDHVILADTGYYSYREHRLL
jgi:DNA repair protein RadC